MLFAGLGLLVVGFAVSLALGNVVPLQSAQTGAEFADAAAAASPTVRWACAADIALIVPAYTLALIGGLTWLGRGVRAATWPRIVGCVCTGVAAIADQTENTAVWVALRGLSSDDSTRVTSLPSEGLITALHVAYATKWMFLAAALLALLSVGATRWLHTRRTPATRPAA